MDIPWKSRKKIKHSYTKVYSKINEYLEHFSVSDKDLFPSSRKERQKTANIALYRIKHQRTKGNIAGWPSVQRVIHCSSAKRK